MSNGLRRRKKPETVVDIKAEYARLRAKDAQDVFDQLAASLNEKKCTVKIYAYIGNAKVPLIDIIKCNLSWEIEISE